MKVTTAFSDDQKVLLEKILEALELRADYDETYIGKIMPLNDCAELANELRFALKIKPDNELIPIST